MKINAHTVSGPLLIMAHYICAVILCTGQACNTNTMFMHVLTMVQNHFEEHDAMGTTSHSVLMLLIYYIMYICIIYVYNYIDW